MSKVIYEKDGRIGRVTLNRPEVLNAIDDELPAALALTSSWSIYLTDR